MLSDCLLHPGHTKPAHARGAGSEDKADAAGQLGMREKRRELITEDGVSLKVLVSVAEIKLRDENKMKYK